MKIIAVGRNYVAHANELHNPVPTSPVIFLKPDTALLKNNGDFYIPEFSNEIHYEVEVVLRICKEGRHVSEKFAPSYYDQIGLGIDFTARDIQQKHKEKGLPWELAKAFDYSAAVSAMEAKENFGDLYQMDFSLLKNQQMVQQGNTRDLIFSFEKVISFVSQYITLRKGDYIFTGTPAGVGPVAMGDHLEGFIGEKKLLDFYIR